MRRLAGRPRRLAGTAGPSRAACSGYASRSWALYSASNSTRCCGAERLQNRPGAGAGDPAEHRVGAGRARAGTSSPRRRPCSRDRAELGQVGRRVVRCRTLEASRRFGETRIVGERVQQHVARLVEVARHLEGEPAARASAASTSRGSSAQMIGHPLECGVADDHVDRCGRASTSARSPSSNDTCSLAMRLCRRRSSPPRSRSRAMLASGHREARLAVSWPGPHPRSTTALGAVARDPRQSGRRTGAIARRRTAR